MAKYKVLEGTHVEGGRSYSKDEVLESSNDLVRTFPRRFQLVSGSPPQKTPNPNKVSPVLNPDEYGVVAGATNKSPIDEAKLKERDTGRDAETDGEEEDDDEDEGDDKPVASSRVGHPVKGAGHPGHKEVHKDAHKVVKHK